ncbi:bifunctional 3-(3-hydroxy-phenyl)propionate/3-hydroxycinnamic acid hydroxylase [Flexivirga meconopsidis]|uniref:bifunctional 3-(3-hydroxy-phenyl)propionate/3-hydroxycinnamic acid hydroxylase MhpA n=1 Tax=Flexivirga meconopsidis TaxID=2977121 RepID=UPI002240BDAD|nr:bifunctional 3-(3-hydroxy-phenyl)propionate/3-hydroxycinnamic acid hydroxylase [Flexivirga meconopsidis]
MADNTAQAADPTTSAEHLHADVVVVGLGPVGLLTSILLGQRSHQVVAVDRWPAAYPLPRAVTFDHEIARILNTVGIDANNDPSIDYHDAIYQMLSADREVLSEIDWQSTAADGWRNRYWFNQPDLEERLRCIVSTLPNVRTVLGYEAVALEQDATSARVTLRPTRRGDQAGADDALSEIVAEASYAVGADGANSFMRNAIGLEMIDLNFYYDWLVVDVVEHETHAYEPPHYQICDPVRPHTIVPGGPGRRRWEFMLLDGEDRETFAAPENVWSLLAPFDVRPDNAELQRAVVWRFQARYLTEWRAGRVILAGDAAHLMPPFAGEGMCAGLRDANALAWRLDLVLRDLAAPDLLDTFGQERAPHAKWFIDFSVGLGEVICMTDPEAVAQRNVDMMASHAEQAKIGPVRPYDATLGPGVWVPDTPGAGAPSAQGMVAYDGRVGRFDEVVGRTWSLLTTVDAAHEVDESTKDRLHRMGGAAHTIGPEHSGADMIDVDGTYTRWFADLGVAHVLLRPDFYVAGSAPAGAGITAVVKQTATRMSLTTGLTA